MKNKPFFNRLGFAIEGVRFALLKESSFRFQSIAAILVLLVITGMRASPIWWGILLLAIGSVLTTEMINTALEKLIDILHPELHPAIKIVKDCAAGAVLISSLISIGVFAAFFVDWLQRLR